MSEKMLKKIAFCSLDEYKTIQKEEGTEYIIDAADISEAITNSDAIDPGHSSESHPTKEDTYKIPVFVKRIYFEKEQDEPDAEPFIVDIYKFNNKYYQQLISSNDESFYINKSHFSIYNDTSIYETKNIDEFFSGYNEVSHGIKEVLFNDKKLFFHYFKIAYHPGLESAFVSNSIDNRTKKNFSLCTNFTIDNNILNLYEDISKNKFDNLSYHLNGEELDTDPFIFISSNESSGLTNYFVVEADSEEIPEKYQEQFKNYKQKILNHFYASKMKFYIKKLDYYKYYNFPDDFIDINLSFSIDGISSDESIKKYDKHNKENISELMMYFETIVFKE